MCAMMKTGLSGTRHRNTLHIPSRRLTSECLVHDLYWKPHLDYIMTHMISAALQTADRRAVVRWLCGCSLTLTQGQGRGHLQQAKGHHYGSGIEEKIFHLYIRSTGHPILEDPVHCGGLFTSRVSQAESAIKAATCDMRFSENTKQFLWAIFGPDEWEVQRNEISKTRLILLLELVSNTFYWGHEVIDLFKAAPITEYLHGFTESLEWVTLRITLPQECSATINHAYMLSAPVRRRGSIHDHDGTLFYEHDYHISHTGHRVQPTHTHVYTASVMYSRDVVLVDHKFDQLFAIVLKDYRKNLRAKAADLQTNGSVFDEIIERFFERPYWSLAAVVVLTRSVIHTILCVLALNVQYAGTIKMLNMLVFAMVPCCVASLVLTIRDGYVAQETKRRVLAALVQHLTRVLRDVDARDAHGTVRQYKSVVTVCGSTTFLDTEYITMKCAENQATLTSYTVFPIDTNKVAFHSPS